MIIAVIGEYGLPGYRRLVEQVRDLCPQDEVLDLNRHNGDGIDAGMSRRTTDIVNAAVVVVSHNFKDVFAGRRDTHFAMQAKGELVFERGDMEEVRMELERIRRGEYV